MGQDLDISKRKAVIFYRIAMLCINLLSLLFGVVYLFNQKGSILWNIYGFIMLTAFIGNIVLSVLDNKDRGLGYGYLILSAISMLILPIINTSVSTLPGNHKSQSVVSVLLIFALLLLGGYIAGRKLLRRKVKLKLEKGMKDLVRNILALLLSLMLITGIFIAFNILKKDKSGILEVFVPEYGLFYAIGYLSIGMLILRLMDKGKKSLYYAGVAVLTAFVFIVCMLPFASTPALLRNAELEYAAAFGTDYGDNTDFNNGFFRPLRFSLPEYFYGTPSGNYNVQENIVYYNGTEGADKGLILSFDVYTPQKDKDQLPGGNSVIIRIHGGGWTIGNKGAANYAQVNKYFASQGYVVFDVQYGLSNKHKLIKSYPVEATRSGNFSINDMIRHIGIFTKYLADHKDEFGANMDSVFISGGSAGGQLISAVGLAIASGSYNDILDSRLKIKGLIPFYPANGLPKTVELAGRPEFVDPTELVAKNSPPSLIYQGDHDGMVDPAIADRFRAAYKERGNNGCAIIKMPFGSHASDFYYSGYYNQVFIYYMERFMYKYK